MRSIRAKLVFGIGLVCLVSLLMIFQSLSHAGKFYVKLHALPEDSRLEVDNKEAGKGVWVKGGGHTFTANKDGYEVDKQVVTVSAKITDLYFVPRAVSEDARRWAAKEDVSVKREMYAGLKASIIGEAINDASPIINLLPQYEIAGPYSIDYGLNDDNSAYLLIGNSTATGRQRALRWIRDAGYNPTELDIRFSDFVNPTTGGEQ